MDKASTYDAIVIGGGPAGASAAALLAEKRHRVAVFEKDLFPRYHVGEALLPGCALPLQRLGLLEKLKSSAFATRSRCLRFVSVDGTESARIDFSAERGTDGTPSWHVLRGEFDKMLLDLARERGAEIHEETEVKEILFENGAAVGVRIEDAQGKAQECRAPITLDCSGRDALAVVQNGWRERDPSLNKTALWTYLAGAGSDKVSGLNDTTVAYLPEQGWFWHIPLPEDTVSVGIVAARDYLYRGSRDPEEIFWREAEKNAWIRTRLESSHAFEHFFGSGDFTYRSRFCSADGLLLAGDAFASLDPIFSSGLLLALKGGAMAADAADAAIKSGVFTAPQFASYGEELCQGAETMRRLTYAFYDANFQFSELLNKYPEIHGELRGCLSGNPCNPNGELFGKIAEFARLPEPLPYGRPRIAVGA
ncbi:MAG: tryptophan 7-halogenase [Planctomycetes bacterium]|nr:tryptophan 7-halogenase [Planctomycetota bacterium]